MLAPTSSTSVRATRRVLALAAIASIALAACGDDDDDAAPPAATAEAAATATEAPAAAATTAAPATTASAGGLGYDYGDSGSTATTAASAAGGEAAVLVGDTGLGEVLTAANGMTVYLFLPDAQGDPTCAAQCAEAWPPVTVGDGASVSGGDGVDGSLLGTATHSEAGTQVTYNGWPLYFFAGDSAPGDTNGQGSGDVWFALDATGNPISNG
jgi:predicted lipoprotein with Yx(FWY)xxD motif